MAKSKRSGKASIGRLGVLILVNSFSSSGVPPPSEALRARGRDALLEPEFWQAIKNLADCVQGNRKPDDSDMLFVRAAREELAEVFGLLTDRQGARKAKLNGRFMLERYDELQRAGKRAGEAAGELAREFGLPSAAAAQRHVSVTRKSLGKGKPTRGRPAKKTFPSTP